MKIFILSPTSIYDRTGVGKVMRSFAENGDLFKKKTGAEVIVKDIYDCKVPKKVSKNNGLQFKLRSWLKDIVIKTYPGAKWFVENRYFGKGKAVLNYYLNGDISNDGFIFHDVYSCYSYINYCQKENIQPKKYILVIHSNGEIFKMLCTSYPKISGTPYEKELSIRGELCLKFASRIVFVSIKSASHFKDLYPAYRDKVSVVYNGISQDGEHSNPLFDGKIRIVTVGTVCVRKNQIALLECVKTLSEKLDISLTIVGGGEELQRCIGRAKELKMEDNVQFLGPRDDVPDILSKSNLFVMTSLDEGLPIAGIEAMKAKLPLILTDVGGNKELIDGNGYLVSTSIKDITNAIEKFANNINKQKSMSEQSYRLYLDKFSLESMINGYSDLINTYL